MRAGTLRQIVRRRTELSRIRQFLRLAFLKKLHNKSHGNGSHFSVFLCGLRARNLLWLKALGLQQCVQVFRVQGPGHRFFPQQILLEHQLGKGFFKCE